MKKLIYITLLAATAIWTGSCSPDWGGGLGDRITDVKIIATATQTPNIYHLSASRKDIIGFWDLGNGVKKSSANEVWAEYPFAGNYTVTLTGYGDGGRTNSVSVIIPVIDNNFDLLDDPIYGMIAGDIGSDEGKTWVVDSLLYGHMLNMNTGDLNNAPNNTAVPVNAAVFPGLRSGELRLGKTLYDDEATFVLSPESGQGFRYVNHGSSLVTNTGSNVFKDQTFMRAASWAPTTAVACSGLALPAGYTGGYNSDWKIDCTPPAGMNWLITKSDGHYWINFPPVANGPGGFLFFALDWLSPYQILSITEDRMVVQKTTMSGTNFGTKSIRRLVMIAKGTESGLPLASIPEADSYVK